MIDKEYLKKLKEDDYIAYDDLMNDPMVNGENSDSSGFVLFCVMCLVVLAMALSMLN